jgi:hypothetical protein
VIPQAAHEGLADHGIIFNQQHAHEASDRKFSNVPCYELAPFSRASRANSRLILLHRWASCISFSEESLIRRLTSR